MTIEPNKNSKSIFWLRPLLDYQTLLNKAFGQHSWSHLLALAVAAVAGWWIYVPVHELLHAFGCLWTGGEVTRLEISPEYGAGLLTQWFDWVAVGSDYAGQLTGFNTHGNDGIYLATVLLPYVLTIFPGMWWYYRALHGDWSKWTTWALTGFSLAMVTAPFVSIFGDMYEVASIMVTRGVSWLQPALPLERWRSDDFLLLISQLWPQWHWSDALGLLTGLLLSIAIIWSIYNIGAALATYLISLGQKRNATS